MVNVNVPRKTHHEIENSMLLVNQNSMKDTIVDDGLLAIGILDTR